jgi:glucose/mannose-6-phosphate isomerase
VALTNLDDAKIYNQLDPSGMRQRLLDLGRQCWDAYEFALRAPLPDAYEQVQSLVVAGMGGSATGGDLLADLVMAMKIPFPVTISRDFDVPSWTDNRTLVLVSSYSGDTEEAISAFYSARERGACIVAFTTGGTLMHLAQTSQCPVIHIDHQGEPRTAVGWGFMALIAVLQTLRRLPGMKGEIAEGTQFIDKLAQQYYPATLTKENPAKSLAIDLYERLPIIYGAGLLSAVARRWKTDINENAKSWAVSEIIPELDHNAVTAYRLPDFARRNVTIIRLRSSFQDPRTEVRFQAIAELLDQAGVEHKDVIAQGVTPLSHILSALCLGGWVSYYLGLLYGVNPSPTPGLDYVKKQSKPVSQKR